MSTISAIQNGLISSAATIDTTNAGGSAVNLYLSTTNSNSSNANTTYGIKNDTTDANSFFGNTNYGTYTKVNNTASTALTKDVYGSYNEVSATGSSNATTNAYGMYLDVSASDTIGGTINNYGLYVNNGTSSDVGTSTKYGIYVETPTGADSNYAAVFAGGNVGVGTTSPTVALDVVGSLKVSGSNARILGAKGANVASATNVTLGNDGNSFLITGTTTINCIDSTSWTAGAVVYLMVSGVGIPTFTDAAACTVPNASLQLAGNFTTSAGGDTLTLIYDGTDWRELARSNN